MLASASRRFTQNPYKAWFKAIPSIVGPSRGTSSSNNLSYLGTSRCISVSSRHKENSSSTVHCVKQFPQLQDVSQYRYQSPKPTLEPTNLPQTCPGCGALTQGIGILEAAGVFNPNRKSVKTYILHVSQPLYCERHRGSQEDEQFITQNSKASQCLPDIQKKPSFLSNEISVPVCNRCHSLLHHGGGQSIIHPSLQSIEKIINDSPHSYNHIYHILDAADFPLSLIPRLHQRLDLVPQRSQNRRSKSHPFNNGHRAELSFIITRSDLLAPQKEQVDSLMPYLLQVLRDALGSYGKDIRLGNVRCVSAKRGWWTRQVKDDIWKRGGGGWMVGKVNVGKSNLFDSIFPKGRRDTVTGENMAIVNSKTDTDQPLHHVLTSSSSGLHPSNTLIRTAEESLLPPPQPEKQFPVMPTVSHLPGTTASPIRIPFGNGKGELIDLPGLARGSLEEHVLENLRASLVMRHRVKPEQCVIKPGQSLLISGLVRITPTTPEVTVLAYPFVPLSGHVTSTEKAMALSAHLKPSGVPVIANPEAGQKMTLAGSFQLRWDVTRQRAGPLTSRSGVGLSTTILPFVVVSTDILIEGCGWVELVAQVRKKDMKHLLADDSYPVVEVWSPNGDYIAARRPMNGWLMNKPNVAPSRRPRRSMKGVKKALKLASRA